MLGAVGGPRVPRHRVGERAAEQVVVAGVEAAEDLGEGVALLGGERGEVAHAPARDDHRLEGPPGPEGNQHHPVGVRAHDALAVRQLPRQAVAEQVRPPRFEMPALARETAAGKRRQVGGGPHLAVGVRVAAPHHLALVLEHLDVGDVCARAQPRVLLRPRVHDRPDLGGRHQGQRQVVTRGEAQHPALAAGGAGHQEAVALDGRLGARQREGGEVVVESERRRVRRVARATRARVPGTQVAGGIVGREVLVGGGLDVPLPRPAQPPRRAEHPLVEQRVVAAVRTRGEAHGRRRRGLYIVCQSSNAAPSARQRAGRGGRGLRAVTCTSEAPRGTQTPASAP